eukprot:TRINITY_DN8250_c0_g1_i1.p1 TRINITY_DN8250_c0_g1~~TRINITY_DN8250_c0_g1_i1.p1  ORF type:complete len:1318 (+),score=215.66 TRINITY_DN8250_c0_g1_i1:272-4225(+)
MSAVCFDFFTLLVFFGVASLCQSQEAWSYSNHSITQKKLQLLLPSPELSNFAYKKRDAGGIHWKDGMGAVIYGSSNPAAFLLTSMQAEIDHSHPDELELVMNFTMCSQGRLSHKVKFLEDTYENDSCGRASCHKNLLHHALKNVAFLSSLPSYSGSSDLELKKDLQVRIPMVEERSTHPGLQQPQQLQQRQQLEQHQQHQQQTPIEDDEKLRSTAASWLAVNMLGVGAAQYPKPYLLDADSKHLKYPTSIVYHQSKNSFYVTDSGNSRILKVTGGKLPEIFHGHGGAGDSLRQLRRPHSLTFDNDDALIADTGNHRIILLRDGYRSGELVFGGKGQGNRLDQLDSPLSVTIHTGIAYVVDSGNSRILQLVPMPEQEGELVAEVFFGGKDVGGNRLDQLLHPSSMTFHKNDAYIADTSNGRILKVANGEKKAELYWGDWGSPLESLAEKTARPTSITFYGDTAYITDAENKRIVRFDQRHSSKGIFADEASLGLSSFYPLETYIHDGEAYIVDAWQNQILKVALNYHSSAAYYAGTYSAGNLFVGTQIPAELLAKQLELIRQQMDSPEDITFHEGDAYIADTGRHRILKLKGGVSGRVEVFYEGQGDTRLVRPKSIVFYDNTAYIVDSWNNRILGLNLKSRSAQVFYGSNASDNSRLWRPSCITFHKGDAYIADTWNDRILRLEAGKRDAEVYFDGKGGVAELKRPTSIVFKGDFAFITDSGNSRIVRLRGSEVSAEILVGERKLAGPKSIAFHDDEAYIVDTKNHQLLRITSDVPDHFEVAYGGGGPGDSLLQLHAPSSITFHGDQGYITDTANNRILVVAISVLKSINLEVGLDLPALLSKCGRADFASPGRQSEAGVETFRLLGPNCQLPILEGSRYELDKRRSNNMLHANSIKANEEELALGVAVDPVAEKMPQVGDRAHAFVEVIVAQLNFDDRSTTTSLNSFVDLPQPILLPQSSKGKVEGASHSLKPPAWSYVILMFAALLPCFWADSAIGHSAAAVFQFLLLLLTVREDYLLFLGPSAILLMATVSLPWTVPASLALSLHLQQGDVSAIHSCENGISLQQHLFFVMCTGLSASLWSLVKSCQHHQELRRRSDEVFEFPDTDTQPTDARFRDLASWLYGSIGDQYLDLCVVILMRSCGHFMADLAETTLIASLLLQHVGGSIRILQEQGADAWWKAVVVFVSTPPLEKFKDMATAASFMRRVRIFTEDLPQSIFQIMFIVSADRNMIALLSVLLKIAFLAQEIPRTSNQMLRRFLQARYTEAAREIVAFDKEEVEVLDEEVAEPLHRTSVDSSHRSSTEVLFPLPSQLCQE